MDKENKEDYEVRASYYFEPVLTPMMMKCIKFDIEMKQYYAEEDRKHEDLMLALKLKSHLLF